jgi:hypothetical protein
MGSMQLLNGALGGAAFLMGSAVMYRALTYAGGKATTVDPQAQTPSINGFYGDDELNNVADTHVRATNYTTKQVGRDLYEVNFGNDFRFQVTSAQLENCREGCGFT